MDLPDGQKRLDDSFEWQTKEVSNAEKIRQMITTSNSDEIGIVYLNCGQGDATIIRLPSGKVMVIDCNTDESPENIAEYLEKAGITKIDYLIITHPHADHMSGTKEIADNFEVGEVWTTDFKRYRNDESSESYEKYKDTYVAGLNKLKQNGTDIKKPIAKNDPIVKDGKLEARILAPSRTVKGDNEDIHEESLALQIKFGKTSFVFTGDTTNEQQKRICEYYPVKSTTIWHASHHGSMNGANEEVMQKVKPRYTIIPVGKDNPHHHPNDEALKIYKENTREKVYRTDRGSIGFRFTADGDSINIQESDGIKINF